ncbi:cold-shock protein [Sneathiella sp.]|uniref:cold-shock protein n=1 Tax=Sneathiella sp. TaxID=1964365 RepID=UPI00345E03BA
MNDRKPSKPVRQNISATVKFFDEAKGFGFVSPADGSPDAFVHISVLQNTSYTELHEGMQINCDLADGDRGQQVVAIHEPEEEEEVVVGNDIEVTGVVTTYVPEHKYGFVTPDGGGEDVFIHVNMLERSDINPEDIALDTKVKCVVRMGVKGPIADSLEIL